MDKDNKVKHNNEHIVRSVRIKYAKENYVPTGARFGLDLPTMSSSANLFDQRKGE